MDCSFLYAIFAISAEEIVKMKLLIADDSSMLRQRLIEMFSSFDNIEIIGEAQNTAQAIEFTRQLKPDVLILDIRMPEKGGIEVLEQIKQDKNSPIVIIYTNYPYPQYRKKCKESGAKYFFNKSTESEAMFKVIEQLCENHTAPILKSNGLRGKKVD